MFLCCCFFFLFKNADGVAQIIWLLSHTLALFVCLNKYIHHIFHNYTKNRKLFLYKLGKMPDRASKGQMGHKLEELQLGIT